MYRLVPSDKKNTTVATWDHTAQVYEIWADEQCDAYLGCADTLEEARFIAKNHLDEE